MSDTQLIQELTNVARLFVEFTPAAVFPNEDPWEELDKAQALIDLVEAREG